MWFEVMSEGEVRRIFEQADDKNKALRALADLTLSTKKEVADFLGVEIISRKPYVIEKKKEVKK